LNESGFPEMEALQWVGILAPAGTPNDIITRLNAALRRILVKPDIVSKLAAQGMTAAASSPDGFKAMISAEIREWKDVAQKAGISLE
jgi:tripartite-type tricarboxylate transporter receptor subunit TctC